MDGRLPAFANRDTCIDAPREWRVAEEEGDTGIVEFVLSLMEDPLIEFPFFRDNVDDLTEEISPAGDPLEVPFEDELGTKSIVPLAFTEELIPLGVRLADIGLVNTRPIGD